MYISPPWDLDNPPGGFLPVVIADTMVTFTGRGGDPMLPIRGRLTTSNHYSTFLARKLAIIGDCVFAFSGEGGAIAKAISHARANVDDWRKLDRPMKPFAAYLSELNRESSSGNSIFGIGVARGRDGNIHRGTPTEKNIELPHYGFVSVHGSGEADLVNQLWEAEQMISRWDPVGVNPFVKANAFVNILNGRKLVQELIAGSQNDWGGFMEWAYLLNSEWKMGPSVLHCFMPNQAHQWPSSMRERAIAYDPNIGTGALLSVSESSVDSYALESVLPSGLNRRLIQTKDWTGWRPEFISVTVMVDPNDPTSIFNKTLNRDEMAYVDFRPTEKGLAYSTSFPIGYIEGWYQTAKSRGTIISKR